MAKQILTAERLRDLLSYDSKTGFFTWRMSRGRCRIGSIAGSLCSDGYIGIKIDCQLYYAHRLAWLYVHGEWPKNQIDHCDEIKTNNWFENLRDVTCMVNQHNKSSPRPNNRLGVLGVSQKGSGFMARIMRGGSLLALGTFSTVSDASEARRMALAQFDKSRQ